MSVISSRVLCIVPASNMYATDASGNGIDPGPSARTKPAEEVIMNATDAERYVYHYASLARTKQITGNYALRMGECRDTNDPKEAKEWHFDLFARGDVDLKGIDGAKLSTLSCIRSR